jgi:hypothetical protein
MAHLAYLWRITANREDVLRYPLTAGVAHFWLVSVKTGVVLSAPSLKFKNTFLHLS